jgi:hypothetical protein
MQLFIHEMQRGVIIASITGQLGFLQQRLISRAAGGFAIIMRGEGSP